MPSFTTRLEIADAHPKYESFIKALPTGTPPALWDKLYKAFKSYVKVKKRQQLLHPDGTTDFSYVTQWPLYISKNIHGSSSSSNVSLPAADANAPITAIVVQPHNHHPIATAVNSPPTHYAPPPHHAEVNRPPSHAVVTTELTRLRDDFTCLSDESKAAAALHRHELDAKLEELEAKLEAKLQATVTTQLQVFTTQLQATVTTAIASTSAEIEALRVSLRTEHKFDQQRSDSPSPHSPSEESNCLDASDHDDGRPLSSLLLDLDAPASISSSSHADGEPMALTSLPRGLDSPASESSSSHAEVLALTTSSSKEDIYRVCRSSTVLKTRRDLPEVEKLFACIRSRFSKMRAKANQGKDANPKKRKHAKTKEDLLVFEEAFHWHRDQVLAKKSG